MNESGGPEYAEVKVGLFGLKTVLIPLQTVATDWPEVCIRGAGEALS